MQPGFTPFSPSHSAAIDLTDRDLSHDMAPVAGRGGLHVQFFYMQVRVSDPDPLKNGSYVTKLCVAKMPIGDRLTCATRFISEAEAMRQFPQQFAQFKSTGEVPTTGTPITELPGISQAHIGLLMIHNIRSIEDLVSLRSEQVQTMGLDINHAWTVAKRWVERREENSDLTASAARETAMEMALVEANRQKEASDRQVLELKAQIEAMKAMGAGGQIVPGMAAAATIAANGAMSVEGETFDAPATEELFSGGMASGSDDLNDDPPPVTRADPLGISKKK
ncbi:hypothetical protein [Neotabrizicola sp. sgz301269]|uniref:hypothetical protein n=1 Tax=Neotabrizicola sp. sgz301269 TaxID=3276282 RepID=UPI0037702A2A